MAKVYLSPREQQIMDILYQQGEGMTAAEVLAALPDEVSNSAVRTHLRILESKGHLRHIEAEGKYIYLPTNPRANAARSALSRVVATFFGGSVEQVVATLLSEKESLSDEEFTRLRQMI